MEDRTRNFRRTPDAGLHITAGHWIPDMSGLQIAAKNRFLRISRTPETGQSGQSGVRHCPVSGRTVRPIRNLFSHLLQFLSKLPPVLTIILLYRSTSSSHHGRTSDAVHVRPPNHGQIPNTGHVRFPKICRTPDVGQSVVRHCPVSGRTVWCPVAHYSKRGSFKDETFLKVILDEF